MEHPFTHTSNTTYCTRVSEHTLTQLRPGYSLPSVLLIFSQCPASNLGGPIPVVLATHTSTKPKYYKHTHLLVMTE